MVNKSRKNEESKLFFTWCDKSYTLYHFMYKKWMKNKIKYIIYDVWWYYAIVIIHNMYFKDFINSFILKSASKRTWLHGTWFGFMVDGLRLLNTRACLMLGWRALKKCKFRRHTQIIWRRKERKRHKEYLLYLHNIPFSTWK
jgi:hypothetical protein